MIQKISGRMAGSRTRTPNGLKLLLMALPFVAFVIAFSYVPLFGWIYAFYDYKPGLALADTAFVGLKYFEQIFRDSDDLIRVLRNTLVMSFMGILTSFLPMVFAILLNEVRSRRFKSFIQTTTTLPNFISWIIVFSLTFAIFSNDGLLNSVLSLLQITPPGQTVLSDGEAVWFFQWAIGTWKTLGWSAIIYLAAISSIDSELYDAAQMDGAGRFLTIMTVTVPGLMATYIVLLLLQISNLLNNGLDQYFVFFNALVADKIEVLDYYVYKVGILTNDYPLSTALGMAKTIVSVILLFTVNFLSKRFRGQTVV